MKNNIQILVDKFWLTEQNVQNLKNYDPNNLELLFRFYSNDWDEEIYLFWYDKNSDEIRWLVVAEFPDWKLFWETWMILIEDLINKEIDKSFKPILRDIFKEKIWYHT